MRIFETDEFPSKENLPFLSPWPQSQNNKELRGKGEIDQCHPTKKSAKAMIDFKMGGNLAFSEGFHTLQDLGTRTPLGTIFLLILNFRALTHF